MGNSSRGYYDTVEELLKAETNGFALVCIIAVNDPKYRQVPKVYGPFDTKREARNARARQVRLFKKPGNPYRTTLVSTSIVPMWKGDLA